MVLIDVSLLGLATAVMAGAISFLSPCVLPLVPGYLSYVAGGADGMVGDAKARQLRVLGPALFFVLGFTTVFVLLGLSAMALGGFLQRYQIEANLIGGGLVVVFGLAMTGLVRLPVVLMTERRWRGPAQIAGPYGAFLLGNAFAFGWTPCIGPVLASILTVTATSAGNGAVLLGAYGLGLGIPFLLTALFLGSAAVALKRMRRAGAALNVGAGVVMVGVGILMMTGRLQEIAIWMLTTFPVLGRIG
ncbi:cytochrome c biogenesis CcdA family protein [Rhodoplanes serenus]|uniref:cytochrome c biogenesis CcdA family protein n=1 Tax=Rhodoplanes serenus TaxID=200615 RepID=UPI000DADA18D|nr:cytochrome c biogenesis protein CcdA [Rhodoplanes serenus]RAI36087.1 cytochrome C biogenesis protein [Rhodoplanes serenus]